MKNNLLCEYLPLEYDHKLLTEAVKNNPNGIITIRALLQRADAQNQNGRVYPRPILERECTRYQTEFIDKRMALGELDHADRLVVELKNVSHKITEIHWEGNDVWGTLEILPTPAGNIAKALLISNVQVGISSRGAGSVIPTGNNKVMVDEDFMLLCFDLVSNPSTQGAFLMEGINSSYKQQKTQRFNALVVDFFAELGK